MIVVTSDVKFTCGSWALCIAEEVLDQKYCFREYFREKQKVAA
jgi:hypothetical protein